MFGVISCKKLLAGAEYTQRLGCAIRVFYSSITDYVDRYKCPVQNNQQDLSVSRINKIGMSEIAAKSIQRRQKIENAVNNG